jgi:hypothetical protein
VVGLVAGFLIYVVLVMISPMREAAEAEAAMPAGEMA